MKAFSRLFRRLYDKMTTLRYNEGYGHGRQDGEAWASLFHYKRGIEDTLLKLEQEHPKAFSQKTLVNATKGAKREELLRLGYEHAIAMVKQVK